MAAQTETLHHERKVLRYRVGPRIIHAMLASSFLAMLITGLMLVWGPLAPYAAGGASRWIHRAGSVVFMLIPVAYLVFDRPAARELLWDSFHYDGDDWKWLMHMYRYFLGYAAEMPPQGRLNAGQKLHHAGVVIFSATIVVSGIIMWVGKGSFTPNSLAITAMLHDLSMLVLTVLLVGHLYFTYVYGALQGMIKGYIPEEDARLEHAKWVESMPNQAPYIIED